MPNTLTKTPLRTGFLRSFIRWLVIGVVLLWSLAALILVAARWIDPPTTAVHSQRRLQARGDHKAAREGGVEHKHLQRRRRARKRHRHDIRLRRTWRAHENDS